MKRRYLSLFLALALLLAGCSGKATDSISNMSMDMSAADMGYAEEMGYAETPMEEPEAEAAAGVTTDSAASIQSATPEQKLIIRAELNTETEDLDVLLPLLLEQITALGGYTERQELHNGSAYAAQRYRSAQLTVRIPAERLGEFTQQVEGQSNVVNYTEYSDDVTLTYVDTQSRMTALQTEQERLLELLAQAENMTDLLEIEARLTDVRYELESVTSRLRVLDNQVNYATVELYIDQVKVYTEVEELTLWQRITTGFTGNLRDIGDWLLDTLVWTLTYSPQLLLLAGLMALLIWLGKGWKRNRKGRRPQSPPQDGEIQ